MTYGQSWKGSPIHTKNVLTYLINPEEYGVTTLMEDQKGL